MRLAIAKDFLLNPLQTSHSLEPNKQNLLALLEHYRGSLSPRERQHVMSALKSHSIIIEAGSQKGLADRKQLINQIHQVLFITSKLYGYKTINEYRVEQWEEIQKHVTNNGYWEDSIGKSYEDTFRLLGNTFSARFADHRYKFHNIAERRKLDKKSDRGYSKNSNKIEEFFRLNPDYAEWKELYDEYFHSRIKKSGKTLNAAFRLMMQFVKDTSELKTPKEYFQARREDFYEWLLKHHDKSQVTYAKLIHEMCNWYIEKYMTIKEEGELTTLGHSLFTQLRLENITKNKNSNGAVKHAESPKLPMPLKFVSLCKTILTENDYDWPKSLDFEYLQEKNEWCPVNTIITLIMLEIPLRLIQVRLLDSGEGDQKMWDGKKWIENTHPSKNHWKKLNKKVVDRGVLNPSRSTENSVDLYINTNKTSDIAVSFGEESGYRIPWHNEEVIKAILYMRAWQEKHNPVTEPKKAISCPKAVWSNNYSKAVLQNTPDRFYLFRFPLHQDVEAPVAHSRYLRFWHHLMQELQRRLSDLGDETSIVTSFYENSDGSKTPTGSIFLPHGLRVTGLTSLLEAGVPLEILSKIIAGHASILMTLHYIKFNNAHISDVLNKASKKIEDHEQENYQNWLKNASWDDANQQSIFNDTNYSEIKWTKSGSKELFENRQIGICPNSGTECETGGKAIRMNIDGKGNDLHAPVEGGSGNCINCRHLITGKPFLVPLWIKTNQVLAESQQLSTKLDIASKELDLLKTERHKVYCQGGNSAISPDLKSKIHQHESRVSRLTTLLDQKCSEAHRAVNLVESVKSLFKGENLNNPSNSPAVFGGASDEFLFTEVSAFERNDFLVQAGRLYEHIDTDIFEKDRNLFIDSLLFNSNLKPISLTRLSEDEKMNALDNAARFLITRLSSEELKFLEQDKITLEELGYKSDLVNSIQALEPLNIDNPKRLLIKDGDNSDI